MRAKLIAGILLCIVTGTALLYLMFYVNRFYDSYWFATPTCLMCMAGMVVCAFSLAPLIAFISTGDSK